MIAQQQGFGDLVEDAYSGKLRLPEFQRGWKWNRARVVRLFDSVRKDYPIGGFLTLEASNKLNLSPRLFEGVNEPGKESMGSYVLDGQQRITAGLALYKGTGGSHYFLNLKTLWMLAVDANLDYDDKSCLESFANDLDEEDKYITARPRSNDPMKLLEDGLLWTPCLTDDIEFSNAKETYLKYNPDKTRFMDRLVWPYFKIGRDPTVPVTVLDSDMPIEAITRVFGTLNTSGQQLTPVEIVVAVLYARGIHLRQELEEFRDSKDHYRHIETTGELFLQTIALLDRKDSKRTTLPKTIDSHNYRSFKNHAVECLEQAGRFLSDRFGAGVDEDGKLIPYPAMLPPLGIALAEIERRFTSPSPDKAHWERNLERWFVGSVLKERYRESQPATQKSDTEELLKWIEDGHESEPGWLNDVHVPSLDRVVPTSAIGKVITCMISRENPKDPLNNVPVGGSGGAIASSQSHHIFPKAFCDQYISDWRSAGGLSNLALNVMPLTQETNKRWSRMNPLDQVADVKNYWPSGYLQQYKPFFINERCLEIMEKPVKSTADFYSFISERGRLVQEYIANLWGFTPSTEQIEDEEEED